MGFGLPAAIGAKLANPDKKVVLFTGDGSIMMNCQEFATVADYNLDIKVVVLNNICLAWLLNGNVCSTIIIILILY